MNDLVNLLAEADKAMIAFTGAHDIDCTCALCAVHGQIQGAYQRASESAESLRQIGRQLAQL